MAVPGVLERGMAVPGVLRVSYIAHPSGITGCCRRIARGHGGFSPAARPSRHAGESRASRLLTGLPARHGNRVFARPSRTRGPSVPSHSSMTKNGSRTPQPPQENDYSTSLLPMTWTDVPRRLRLARRDLCCEGFAGDHRHSVCISLCGQCPTHGRGRRPGHRPCHSKSRTSRSVSGRRRMGSTRSAVSRLVLRSHVPGKRAHGASGQASHTPRRSTSLAHGKGGASASPSSQGFKEEPERGTGAAHG